MYFPLIILLFFLLQLDFICAELNGWEMPTADGTPEMLHPVFLVHGFTGSKAYVSGQNIQYPPGHKCTKNETAFHKAWVSKVLKNDPDCEFYWLGLDYDSATGEFKDRPGVTVDFHGPNEQFGSLEPMQCLWKEGWYYLTWTCLLPYFRPLVNWLGQVGYTPGQNMFGAVYDWRQHPSSPKMADFFAKLKEKIEQAVEKNGGKKAHIIAHSYGNIVINHFLWECTNEEWHQKYIESTVNVAAPFGGSAVAIHQLLYGVDKKFWVFTVVNRTHVRNFARSLATTAILIPRPETFNSSHAFLQFASDGYGLDRMNELLELANSAHLFPIYRNHSIRDNGQIPMHCVYGTGIDTQLTMQFNTIDDYMADIPYRNIINGDGDGTVNIESLRLCSEWKRQNSKISVLEIPKADHESVLNSKAFLDHLRKILVGNLLKGEYYAMAVAPVAPTIKVPRKFARPSSAGKNGGPIICESRESLAQCPMGTKPNRWTKKNVKFICFNADQETGERIGEKEFANGKRGMAPERETREVMVPLTCI